MWPMLTAKSIWKSFLKILVMPVKLQFASHISEKISRCKIAVSQASLIFQKRFQDACC